MKTISFKKIYWGEEKETEVKFEIATSAPPTSVITTCFVMPTYQNLLVMTKYTSGWGFPGGHREKKESPEGCIRRESMEEASIVLGNLNLVGRWKATKVFETKANRQYPETAYQLFYTSEVIKFKEFKKTSEFLERRMIPTTQLCDYYTNYDDYADVFDYCLSIITGTL